MTSVEVGLNIPMIKNAGNAFCTPNVLHLTSKSRAERGIGHPAYDATSSDVAISDEGT